VTWASQGEAEEEVVVVVATAAALKEAVVVEVEEEEDTGSLSGVVPLMEAEDLEETIMVVVVDNLPIMLPFHLTNVDLSLEKVTYF
jgi:hypothetical protein